MQTHGGFHGATLRVAVADDDPHVRQALADLVATDPGLTLVAAAADADQAIAAAIATHPDVMLMDMRMPFGGGVRAIKEIKRAMPSVRVVAVSAYDDRAAVLEMLGAGAVGYVVKGGAGEEILGAIHRAAAGKATISQDISAQVVDELSSRLEIQARQEAIFSDKSDRIRAVLADPEAMTIVYQPTFDLRTEAITAFEALARFSPEPIRPPDVWFNEATEVGLGVELELAAVRTALRQLSRIPEPTRLSVNLSPAALVRPEIRDLVDPETGARLILEITEHAPVEDYETLEDALADLRGRGAQVAVDDAGAGFASLRHILRIDPDVIKLDVSLTRHVDRDRARRALASALISFAEQIEAQIVAEGIETEAELEALRELGVGYGQGFHLGRPAPLPPALRVVDTG